MHWLTTGFLSTIQFWTTSTRNNQKGSSMVTIFTSPSKFLEPHHPWRHTFCSKAFCQLLDRYFVNPWDRNSCCYDKHNNNTNIRSRYLPYYHLYIDILLHYDMLIAWEVARKKSVRSVYLYIMQMPGKRSGSWLEDMRTRTWIKNGMISYCNI